jgi:mono/diheme cytochrome c family protein
MKRIMILGLFGAVVFCTAWGVITLYDENMSVGRMWETPGVKPHEQPLLVMEEGIVPLTGGEVLRKAEIAQDLGSPLNSQDPIVIAQGEKAYFTYCAQCHGKHMDGKGTVGQSFYPLPRNLRSAQVLDQSDGQLFASSSYGKKRMPAMATTVTEADRWAIIHYIRSLPPAVQAAN